MLDSHAKQCLALIGGLVVASLYGTSWSALGVGRAVGTLQGAHCLGSPPFIKRLVDCFDIWQIADIEKRGEMTTHLTGVPASAQAAA